MTTSEPDSRDDAAHVDEDELPWPVGFIAIASLAALYVAWRVIQLIGRGLTWVF